MLSAGLFALQWSPTRDSARNDTSHSHQGCDALNLGEASGNLVARRDISHLKCCGNRLQHRFVATTGDVGSIDLNGQSS